VSICNFDENKNYKEGTRMKKLERIISNLPQVMPVTRFLRSPRFFILLGVKKKNIQKIFLSAASYLLIL
jgi:hypothetical protein